MSERIAVIINSRGIKAYLIPAVGFDAVAFRPSLEWHFNDAALNAKAARDAWHAVLTKLGRDITAVEVVRI